MRKRMKGLFVPVDPQNYLPRLTILENVLYGKVSAMAGVQGELIEDIVAEVLEEKGLKRLVAETILDVKTSLEPMSLAICAISSVASRFTLFARRESRSHSSGLVIAAQWKIISGLFWRHRSPSASLSERSSFRASVPSGTDGCEL